MCSTKPIQVVITVNIINLLTETNGSAQIHPKLGMDSNARTVGIASISQVATARMPPRACGRFVQKPFCLVSFSLPFHLDFVSS